jgi:phosphatidylglycerophosphate synthase
VTLARGALTAFVLALVGAPALVAEAWIALAVALAALALDHVDGRLARERGETSAFGARFDMETDALLMLGLSVLVWQYDKAGAWVLAAGALRYVFVACGWLLPWLARPLPPSRRRQAVCVVQTAALLGALAPVVVAPVSAVVAAAGLAVLVVSFAIDVRWLARSRGALSGEAAAP